MLGSTYTDLNGEFSITITADSLYLGDSLMIAVKMFGYLPFSKNFKIKPVVDSSLYLESGVRILEKIDIIRGPISTPIIMGGAMMGFVTLRNRTALGQDQYDTKTYKSKEIENFNLGR